MLGISMGAKQVLTILLGDGVSAGVSVLGLLSGMFQGDHLAAVHGDPSSWPTNVGQSLELYFHYCGRGGDVPDGTEAPAGRRGDAAFFENNNLVCTRLGGTELRVRDDGMHNWFFWRPELAEFFRALNTVW